ncbi:hypothetical protein E3Q12_01320 [Wallemia mellicola]|uniref:G-patch domain-containing protein n=1 Tax=Wallemia mellicola TaxID=1708541 RepID=A0AB74KFG0_9BASI|nr:hypothetical protein E3Q12_01320 [Wallemia mellicola]TIC61970.1 hypothetical protein E3Q03_02506 [Wallemia mellicola]
MSYNNYYNGVYYDSQSDSYQQPPSRKPNYSSGVPSHNPRYRGPNYREESLKLSPENDHVIILGFEDFWTEEDLKQALESLGGSVETTTIIKEKGTGISRGFGFAKFSSIAHASAFVKPRFPTFQLPGSELRQKIDFSASAQANEYRKTGHNRNDGTRDIGNVPCKLVLIRGLDQESTEYDVKYALKQANAKPKRVAIIRDRECDLSFGFGFVEFANIPSAQSFIAVTLSPDAYPTGFRIQDKLIACTFALEQSLTGLDAPKGHNDGIRYWDGTGKPTVIDCEEGWQEASQKVRKKQKVDTNTKGALHGLILPQGPPPKPDQSKKPKGLSKSSTGPIKIGIGNPVASSSNSANTSGPTSKPKHISILGQDESDDDEPVSIDPSTSEDKSKKNVPQLAANRKTASKINLWNQKQDELRTTMADPAEQAQTQAQSAVVEKPSAAPVRETSQQSEKNDFDYSDTNKMACLLCQRQFKTIEVLRKHTTQSDLHKNNLKNETVCQLGRERKASSVPKYTDRAVKRREVYGQPDNPIGSQPNKKRRSEQVTETTATPEEEAPDKGKNLLEKMGWSQGAGLGNSNEGIVNPVESLIYEGKAGLGASKGKDLGYASRGYVENARVTAKERYEENKK